MNENYYPETTENEQKPEKPGLLRRILGGIVKPFFNKGFYIVLALLFQIGWIAGVLFWAMSYFPLISVVLRIFAILLVWHIVNKRINPSFKLAWTALILAVPVFGVVLYITLGRSRTAQEMHKRYKTILEDSRQFLRESSETRERLEKEGSIVSNQSRYIRDKAGFPLLENTSARYFQIGDEMFPFLVQELCQARKFIFIEYFIIHDGVLWQTILDILAMKAAKGVDVRIIYDGFGCFSNLPSGYPEKLRKMKIGRAHV